MELGKVQRTAGELNIDPDIIKRLNKQAYMKDNELQEVHAYDNSIALVELRWDISYNDGTKSEYALMTPNGHLFPFEPEDVDTLGEMCDQTGLTDGD